MGASPASAARTGHELAALLEQARPWHRAAAVEDAMWQWLEANRPDWAADQRVSDGLPDVAAALGAVVFVERLGMTQAEVAAETVIAWLRALQERGSLRACDDMRHVKAPDRTKRHWRANHGLNASSAWLDWRFQRPLYVAALMRQGKSKGAAERWLRRWWEENPGEAPPFARSAIRRAPGR